MRTVYYLYSDNCYNHSGLVPDNFEIFNGVYVEPPSCGQYEIQKWDYETSNWILVPNYMFKTVYDKDTGNLVNKERGQPLLDNETINYDDINENVRKLAIIPSVKTNILNYFDELMENGYTYQGNVFQSRELDLNRINLTINSVNIGGSFGGLWRDKDNQWISLTFEQLKELGLSLGGYWQQKFIKSRLLIDDLINLSIDDLKNYNVEDRFNQN
jgi:hypothetical protein